MPSQCPKSCYGIASGRQKEKPVFIETALFSILQDFFPSSARVTFRVTPLRLLGSVRHHRYRLPTGKLRHTAQPTQNSQILIPNLADDAPTELSQNLPADGFADVVKPMRPSQFPSGQKMSRTTARLTENVEKSLTNLEESGIIDKKSTYQTT